MRPLKLSLSGPELPIPEFLQPWMRAGASAVAAPVAREVTSEVLEQAQPVIQSTARDAARTAAREVWTSIPKYALVGGAVVVASLVAVPIVLVLKGR